MNTSLFPLAGFLPVLLLAPLHAQSIGTPVLTTPGTATWTTHYKPGGSTTVFTITANTVFDWENFNLPFGSELIFDFVGGNTVANLLNGTGIHSIAGNVTSNGNVGFFSPHADLEVTGNITAKSVTLAAMDVDAPAFLSGGNYTMSGNFNGLTVLGEIKATGGEVVLAGGAVNVGPISKINAKGAAQFAGGTEITVARNGAGQRLKQKGEVGFVLHMGETRASRIEIAAGNQIVNEGRLDVGKTGKQIFLEVGKGGKITKGSSSIIVGKVSVNGKQETRNSSWTPNEGDAASVVSSSSLKMPALKRPDGSVASGSRMMVNHAPMSASGDGGRDRKRPNQQQVASRDRGSKPLLQRASFFGMRGGDTSAKK